MFSENRRKRLGETPRVRRNDLWSRSQKVYENHNDFGGNCIPPCPQWIWKDRWIRIHQNGFWKRAHPCSIVCWITWCCNCFGSLHDERNSESPLVYKFNYDLPSRQQWRATVTVTVYPTHRNVSFFSLLSLISNNNFDTHQAYRHQFTKEMMHFPQHKIYGTDEVSHSPC